MTYVLGVVLFAIGILISVALHEAGHMGTAQMFGMKVTRFFIGFGPTLWSFGGGRRSTASRPFRPAPSSRSSG